MRLIDADRALEIVRDQGIAHPSAYHLTHYATLILMESPTIEVEPVRHGRWIGAPLCGNDDCKCSECGNWCNIHVNLCGKVIQKYCPYCGAKMNMEEEDG